MAATRYNVFVRYMNNGKTISQQTEIDWMSYYENQELKAFNTKHAAEYNNLVSKLANGTLKKDNFSVYELDVYTKCKKYRDFEEAVNKGQAVREHVHIEPFDEKYVNPEQYSTTSGSRGGPSPYAQRKRFLNEEKTKRDLAQQSIMVEQSKPTNPKYEMIFMYNGIGKCEAEESTLNANQNNTDPPITPYVYYDEMKRVKCNPWFFYEQFGSLQAAMNRSAELVNIFGKGNVLIGKEVALDQYIDIV